MASRDQVRIRTQWQQCRGWVNGILLDEREMVYEMVLLRVMWAVCVIRLKTVSSMCVSQGAQSKAARVKSCSARNTSKLSRYVWRRVYSLNWMLCLRYSKSPPNPQQLFSSSHSSVSSQPWRRRRFETSTSQTLICAQEGGEARQSAAVTVRQWASTESRWDG